MLVEADLAAPSPERLVKDHLMRLARLRNDEVRRPDRRALRVAAPRKMRDGLRLVDLAIGILGGQGGAGRRCNGKRYETVAH